MQVVPTGHGAPVCVSCAAIGRTTSADTTIRLSLGDRSGTADLCAEHLQALQDVVVPLLDASPGRQRRRPDATTVPRLRGHEDREVIRAWAAARGLPVASSGGISVAILNRYRAEMSGAATIPLQADPLQSSTATRP